MKHNFKVGDKVKIPTRKTTNYTSLSSSLVGLEINENTKFLTIYKVDTFDNEIGILNPNVTYPNRYLFKPEDLELYHEEMTIPKVLSQQLDGTIIEVQDIDGGIYKIGDKIKFFNGSDKVSIIIGFKWNNDRTNICALTNVYNVWGVGIDKIELFIEKSIIKQETLLEEAIRRYPIGTQFKSTYGAITTVKGILYETLHGIYDTTGREIYRKYDNVWATPLEEVQPEPEFVLPTKWRIKRTPDNYKVINDWCNANPVNEVDKQSRLWGDMKYSDAFSYIYSEVPDNAMNLYQRRSNSQDNSFTDITFEQFQQYVNI